MLVSEFKTQSNLNARKFNSIMESYNLNLTSEATPEFIQHIEGLQQPKLLSASVEVSTEEIQQVELQPEVTKTKTKTAKTKTAKTKPTKAVKTPKPKAIKTEAKLETSIVQAPVQENQLASLDDYRQQQLEAIRLENERRQLEIDILRQQLQTQRDESRLALMQDVQSFASDLERAEKAKNQLYVQYLQDGNKTREYVKSEFSISDRLENKSAKDIQSELDLMDIEFQYRMKMKKGQA